MFSNRIKPNKFRVLLCGFVADKKYLATKEHQNTRKDKINTSIQLKLFFLEEDFDFLINTMNLVV